MEEILQFQLLDTAGHDPIAQVHLNGYSIEAGGPLGISGAMRSFTILEGSVRQHWRSGQPLILFGGDGKQALVKIAALPVEEGEVGIMEFL